MLNRTAQKAATRTQIVTASLVVFAESGFDAASTRAIAERADVSQGLLTYHFKTKESLWKEAVNHLFSLLSHQLSIDKSLVQVGSREQARELLKQFVHFNAAHPELLRFMSDRGKGSEVRTKWIVDTHMKPMFEMFSSLDLGVDKCMLPHFFYVFVGASSAIFNAQSECMQLTGVDPCAPDRVILHGNYLVDLLLPIKEVE
jgi:TetR/AcrR family transcriptional regulator